MHLAFDLSFTHLDGRWRVPGSWTGRLYPDVGIYESVFRMSVAAAFGGRIQLIIATPSNLTR